MRATERAFSLLMTLFVGAVLAVLAVALLTGAQYSAANVRSTETKNLTFDAAEAGLNSALDALDVSLLATTGRTATLANGYSYTYTVYPNFGIGSLLKTVTDPLDSLRNVSIPALSAIIVSVGSGPNGVRPTTVEAVVSANVTSLSFQKYAIVAGRNVQGNFNPQTGVTDMSGANSANIHANGSINAKVGGGVQGSASASGPTNSLPPGTVNTAVVPLPTVSQFDFMVANYLNQSKLLGNTSNVYLAGNATLAPTYTCTAGLLTGGCLLFYDGPLVMTQGQVTFSGPWTVVINGDFKQTGQAQMQFLGSPAKLIVNGNASIEGNGASGTYLLVKGNTDLGGNGNFTGAVETLGNLSFQGGGSTGGFVYNPNDIPPPISITGLVKVVTYAEY